MGERAGREASHDAGGPRVSWFVRVRVCMRLYVFRKSSGHIKNRRTTHTHAPKHSAEDAKVKQKSEENTMKKIARRFEAAKVAVLEERGVTESLRFDPKLKAKGLLDLYMDKQPDSAVPDSPKAAGGGDGHANPKK